MSGTTMNDQLRRVTTCRVCGANDWRDVLSFGATPLANDYRDPRLHADDEMCFPLDVIVCRQCWLVALRQVVSPELLYRDYVYVSSDSLQIARHMHDLAARVVDRFQLPPQSLVVEWGSNIGTQLVVFREMGMRVLGIDPARNLAAVANAAGVETIPDYFNSDLVDHVLHRSGRPRVLIGRHVLAHIDDLGGVLTAARRLLDTSGVLAIEVPHVLNLLAGNQFDTIYHEHLSYFSVRTLRHLFERHGFRVIDVTSHDVHGGSIVMFACHPEGPWPTGPSVAVLEQIECEAGIFREDAYLQFAHRARTTMRDLGDLVRGLVHDGKRVAGYGAPAKGNTLLNACGLDHRDLMYVSDTTPSKQGKVLPGTRVPIVSPAYARAHLPDYFLLLPWNYAHEIIARERPMIDAGVRFIIPVPEPRVVGAVRSPESPPSSTPPDGDPPARR